MHRSSSQSESFFAILEGFSGGDRKQNKNCTYRMPSRARRNGPLVSDSVKTFEVSRVGIVEPNRVPDHHVMEGVSHWLVVIRRKLWSNCLPATILSIERRR